MEMLACKLNENTEIVEVIRLRPCLILFRPLESFEVTYVAISFRYEVDIILKMRNVTECFEIIIFCKAIT